MISPAKQLVLENLREGFGMRINDTEQAQIGLVVAGDDSVFVANISVTSGARGLGFGSKCLDRLCERADELGVSLQLIAASDGFLSQRQLKAWYERRGFEACKTDNDWMFRKAKIGATA